MWHINFFTGSLDRRSNCSLWPHRERMNLKAPIYFSTGLTEKANHYYKLFITWTNQKIRKTFVQRNMFEFKHIKAFDRSYADNPGPMVSPIVRQKYAKFLTEEVKVQWSKIMWTLSGGVCNTRYAACRSVFADIQEMGWQWEEHGEYCKEVDSAFEICNT